MHGIERGVGGGGSRQKGWGWRSGENQKRNFEQISFRIVLKKMDRRGSYARTGFDGK